MTDDRPATGGSPATGDGPPNEDGATTGPGAELPADSTVASDTPAETHRPLIERIGLAAIALVLAAMFGGVSAASWAGGEPFLAVMGGIGCLMTIWVGVLTLVRG